jgi:hypothetical protein
LPAYGAPTRFGLHEQRLDRTALPHDDSGREGVEQELRAAGCQEIVGCAFVRRGVVGLRHRPAKHDMRLVQAAEPVDAAQELVGNAVDHTADVAVDVGVQPAEVRDAGSRAHPAEEAVALDEERTPPRTCGARRARNAGRPTTEHDDLVLAMHRRVARRLAHRVLAHGPKASSGAAPRSSAVAVRRGAP